MNRLEQNIRDRREQFDAFEPSGGHMDRFRKKLYPEHASVYARIPYWVKIAAILLLVAVSSVLIYEQAQRYYISRQQPLEEIIPGEYQDAQFYYTSLIKKKYTEINSLDISDPEGKKILLNELKEMDQLFQSLLKDLQTNPSDERVLSAMISHYQTKLEVMGQIIQQLENVNKINSTLKSHENTEI